MTNCTAKNPFNKVPGCPLVTEELKKVLWLHQSSCVYTEGRRLGGGIYRPLDGPGFLPSCEEGRPWSAPSCWYNPSRSI